MRFPTGFPDFTTDQRRGLKRHGVCDEQITELRHALISVRQHVRRPAANNDVAAQLAEIERLASELSRKLRAAVIPDAARMIEERYWPQRPTDDGPTVAMHLCPRLDALTVAAGGAAGDLPRGVQSRSRVGNPEPVQWIDDALFNGWAKAHGTSAVHAWIDPNNEDAAIAAAIERDSAAMASAKPYPKNFRPSVSVTSPFYEIVCICYAAVGYQDPPKSAVARYVKAKNAQHRVMREALDDALNELQ